MCFPHPRRLPATTRWAARAPCHWLPTPLAPTATGLDAQRPPPSPGSRGRRAPLGPLACARRPHLRSGLSPPIPLSGQAPCRRTS
eukprot:9923535-Alexandrium_andersonii.AAC.1